MNEKYIPLYRKYRPQKLEEIVGQSHIKKALKNAIEMNKISHAYLFTGPRGTGKTSTARIFAKSLNCEKGPTINPCNECSNCVNITQSIPIDVIEIDAASNRSVNDADELIKKVIIAPVQSRYKIYIIDEVHMLTPQAFNALLKTLEEPPKNVIFILATTEVHKVLDTIKSRCQRFDFRRITTEDIVKHLRYISDQEKINITDDALYTIAKNSAGGMRDSIALLDQLSILGEEEAILTDDINNLLGRISFDKLKVLSSEIVNSNPQGAIEILEDIYNSGNEPTQILNNLLDYFKNLLIVKNCRAEIIFELTQLNEIQIKELSEQVKDIETHQISALIEKTENYIKEVKTTNNPKLWLEVGIIDLANLTENTKLADLQNRLIKLESGAPVAAPNSNNYITQPSPISTMHKIKEQIMAQQKGSGTKKVELQPEVKPEIVVSDQNNEPNTKSVEESVPVTKNSTTEATELSKNDNLGFSPMPVAKPAPKGDISDLWGQLLSAITSKPTEALLKQWGYPVKISPEETIIAIKTEIFLNKFNSGDKKTMVANAVNTLFSQENSNVIIRLAQPNDVVVKPAPTKPIPPKKVVPVIESQPEYPDEEEVEEAKQEVKGIEKNSTEVPSQPQKHQTGILGHSDQVNMVMDLFDGKIIE